MDGRKFQRIAAAVGVLLLILLSGVFFLNAVEKVIYEADANQAGILAEHYPEDKTFIASVFNGKLNAGTTMESQDNSQNVNYETTGSELLEKYGYTLSNGTFSTKLREYALIFAVFLTSGVFLEILILIRGFRKAAAAENHSEFLNEKLRETKDKAERMEAQLRQEEQDTKALITDISHQLKTPLASLKMSYELADSTDLSAEERAEFIQKEREEVAKLESLMNLFTRLTRLETGMIHLQPETASLKETLTSAVGGIYMKAFEKQIEIVLEEFDDIQILHDPRWTGEIFLNILDNAVKYSPSGTTVTIRVSELVSYIMIEFEDQGIGIELSETQNIFKRFYRGSSPEVKNADGSGVGLYLARKIIEQQGGTICVKPGKKKGSNFILTLPKQ